jgi:hypothetical protein
MVLVPSSVFSMSLIINVFADFGAVSVATSSCIEIGGGTSPGVK